MSRENEPVQHTSEMRDGREERDMKAPGELVTEMWDVRVLVSAENDHGLGNIEMLDVKKGSADQQALADLQGSRSLHSSRSDGGLSDRDGLWLGC